MIKALKNKYALSNQGAKDLLKGIIYSVLANISLMFPVILLAIVLNQLLASILGMNAPEISAIVYTVIGIVILAVVFIFHYCQYTAAYLGTYDESARRRISLAEKLRTLPLTFFHQRDIADLTSTIMGDCANFEHAFSHTVPQFFGAVISTGIVCVGLLIFNWQMGLALLWVAPISFAIVLLSRKWQEKLSKKHMNARLELAEGIQECLETVQDIKACNQEEDYLRKLDAKMDAAEKAQISSEMTTASLLTTGQMFLRLGLATVIVVGNSLVVNGNATLFTYILFLIAASRLYDPLSGAMANMAELFSVQLQVNRLKEIEEYPEETGEKEIHTNGYDITFDHVRFSYEKDKPVLRDVSFTAKQGQVTALVGPSGGGKSTVAKLAAKFYPLDGGRILLGGTDIAPLNSTMLMKNFSIVFQDVVLFNNTIMENIRVGKKDATDEEVIAAAKAAQCDEFISKLPDGYQTVIGENGSTLSGGECQRLSIARALLKDAPVILLDEATASLDVDNETEIQNAISRLVKGKTVLIIAHRMRTVEAADNIVVLSDGMVVETGRFADSLCKLEMKRLTHTKEVLMKLHASGEDYLEAILVLHKKMGMVRSVDVARHMEVTKPSVCHAVNTLKDGGFLTMDEDHFLYLTDIGREVAEKIYERHCFFRDRLIAAGVDPKTAETDACRMEHNISMESFEKLRDYYSSQKGK